MEWNWPLYAQEVILGYFKKWGEGRGGIGYRTGMGLVKRQVEGRGGQVLMGQEHN